MTGAVTLRLYAREEEAAAELIAACRRAKNRSTICVRLLPIQKAQEAKETMWFRDLISNQFLLTGISSWLWAQVLKTIIHALVTHRLDLSRLVGDGGMPSGHSATVASLTTTALLCYGPGSFQFAISLILAVVVCKDAMGVRLETGKQAVMLNEMMRVFNVLTSSEQLPEVKLKEFVGHTPIQVMAGILLGIANAVVMYELVL